MITEDQVNFLSRKLKTNQTTVFREYLQLLFLNQFYSSKKSEKVYFKGGTAIHLIFKAPRFSEDLDFTVNQSKTLFLKYLKQVFEVMKNQADVEYKERETIAGLRFLMTGKPSVLPYKTYVNLDFSFREKVFKTERSVVSTDFPVLFTSFVYHLSAEEILAEKIRAILTRDKGRDLYDLWYLLSISTKINKSLILEKFKYYRHENLSIKDVIGRIENFPPEKFVLDLKPFVPLSEREKLPEFYKFIKASVKENL